MLEEMNSVEYIKREIENEIAELQSNIDSFSIDDDVSELDISDRQLFHECLKSFVILNEVLANMKRICQADKQESP